MDCLQYGRGVLDPTASPYARLCSEMRTLETYLCVRSTTEPASIIAAIELAMIALWWTEGAGDGTVEDPFAVDPFALKYDPNLDEADRGERASAHLIQLLPASSSREAPMAEAKHVDIRPTPSFFGMRAKKEPGKFPRHFWLVKPTGDYGADCDRGVRTRPRISHLPKPHRGQLLAADRSGHTARADRRRSWLPYDGGARGWGSASRGDRRLLGSVRS